MTTETLSINELERRTGVKVRNIRLYISLGCVDRPIRGGRNAVYSTDHVQQILNVVQRQNDGYTLQDIARLRMETADASWKTQEFGESSLAMKLAPDFIVIVPKAGHPRRRKCLMDAAHAAYAALNSQYDVRQQEEQQSSTPEESGE